MKTFLPSSKGKLGIKTSFTGESFRKLFTVWEIKRLGYPAFRKVFFNFLISLLKSEEIRLAPWRAAVMQFLFQWEFPISNV